MAHHIKSFHHSRFASKNFLKLRENIKKPADGDEDDGRCGDDDDDNDSEDGKL